MSWLRLDDGFASHPKIAALNDREFRVWIRLLLYCARYRTKGVIDPVVAANEVPGFNPKTLRLYTALGLLDEHEEQAEDGSTMRILTVHDWADYNDRPNGDYTAADRQRRRRARDTDRDGNRDTDRDTPVTETVNPRAGTRARSRPHPQGGGREHRGRTPGPDGAGGAGPAYDNLHPALRAAIPRDRLEKKLADPDCRVDDQGRIHLGPYLYEPHLYPQEPT